jgi:tartrate dehydratase alpha subunit/fumarate hydratase class I-like protein
MRTLHVSAITDAVKKLCMDANYELEPDVLRVFDRALGTERSPAGRQVLQILKDNAALARDQRIPYCQDTGFVVCFAEVGQDVHVTGGLLTDAINAGIRAGYAEGYLRASIVRSPFDRVNTGDNTPGVIHVSLVPGATKRALFRELGSPNPDSTLDALERELLERASRLGIGPQGYGGDTTALGIHVLTYPCHITSLPVAVTIECQAHRHKEAVL